MSLKSSITDLKLTVHHSSAATTTSTTRRASDVIDVCVLFMKTESERGCI